MAFIPLHKPFDRVCSAWQVFELTNESQRKYEKNLLENAELYKNQFLPQQEQHPMCNHFCILVM